MKENTVLYTDQKEICEVLNECFINVAQNIGDSSVNFDSTHESIGKIDNLKVSNTLNFSSIYKSFVEKQIRAINTKEAIGNDKMSVKMLKIASPVLSEPLVNLVNRSFDESIFPENMKVAQIEPIHKRSSTLDKLVNCPSCQRSMRGPSMSSYYIILMRFLTPFLLLLVRVMAVTQLFLKLLKTGKNF